jgi:hypothetical protein
MAAKTETVVVTKTNTKCTHCTTATCPPPKFGDLNKKFNDLALDNFGFGEYTLALKAVTADGVALRAEESVKASDKSVSSLLEAKYTNVAHGLSIKGSFDTKANASVDVSLENKSLKGFKITATEKCSPTSSSWWPESWKLKAEYTNSNVATETSFDGKDISSNVVAVLPGAKVGVSTTYNLGKSAITSTGIAAKLCLHGVGFTTSLTDLALVKASAVHTHGAHTLGAEVGYNVKTGLSAFAAATKSVIDADSFIKTSVTSDGKVGLAFTQRIAQGITLTLASQINSAEITIDKHSFGASITFEK